MGAGSERARSGGPVSLRRRRPRGLDSGCGVVIVIVNDDVSVAVADLVTTAAVVAVVAIAFVVFAILSVLIEKAVHWLKHSLHAKKTLLKVVHKAEEELQKIDAYLEFVNGHDIGQQLSTMNLGFQV